MMNTLDYFGTAFLKIISLLICAFLWILFVTAAMPWFFILYGSAS